jgi:hypothetical protein
MKIEGGSSISPINNIFYNAGTGVAVNYVSSALTGNASNYNVMYTTGTVIGVYNGASVLKGSVGSELATWNTTAAQDANSNFSPVTFVSASTNDLSLTQVDPKLFGIGSTSNGTYNSGIRNLVADDMFGNSRSRSEVYSGAHQLIPIITFNPAPPALLTGCANQNLTISANATVSYGAQLSYTWQRNGAPLLDGSNGVSGASTNTVSITGAQPSLNGGDYVLVVNGTGGADPLVSNIISVVINAPIVINQDPQSRIVCQGSEASLAVVASGTILSYQWQKDGINIAGATTPIFVIKNAAYGQSGRYRVVMSGTCGTTTVNTADAVIYVASSTLIGRQPTVSGAAPGSTGYLNVDINATAQIPGYSPMFQWYKGTSMLKDDGRISGSTTNQLTIRNMTTADISQDYSVVVTGLCGNQTSTMGGFYVSQISIMNQPQNSELCSGSTGSLGVSVSSNIPGVQYSYQWMKDGKAISNNGTYQGTSSSMLSISNADASVAGDYTVLVTASPTGATINSNAATVTVISAPAISTQPANVSVCVGSPFNMTVAGSGGTISYQWKVNGITVPGQSTNRVDVPAADMTMNGAKVTVELTNNCGSTTSAEAMVTVNDKPTITMQPGNKDVFRGSSYTVTVTATNATDYQWKKDGAIIPGATNASYTITNFGSSSVGNYLCEVKNACGTVNSGIATLSVSSTEEEALAAGYSLSQAQPAPATDKAVLTLTSPENAMVSLVLIDMNGRAVATLYNGVSTERETKVAVDVTSLTSGTYQVIMRSGNYMLSSKMLVTH